MGCRTNVRLAQSEPPLGEGFRGIDCERQSVGRHRFSAIADQKINLTHVPQSQRTKYNLHDLDSDTKTRKKEAKMLANMIADYFSAKSPNEPETAALIEQLRRFGATRTRWKRGY